MSECPPTVSYLAEASAARRLLADEFWLPAALSLEPYTPKLTNDIHRIVTEAGFDRIELMGKAIKHIGKVACEAAMTLIEDPDILDLFGRNSDYVYWSTRFGLEGPVSEERIRIELSDKFSRNARLGCSRMLELMHGAVEAAHQEDHPLHDLLLNGALDAALRESALSLAAPFAALHDEAEVQAFENIEKLGSQRHGVDSCVGEILTGQIAIRPEVYRIIIRADESKVIGIEKPQYEQPTTVTVTCPYLRARQLGPIWRVIVDAYLAVGL